MSEDTNERFAAHREINGFVCENEEKFLRAAEGSPTAQGTPVGGVGYENKLVLLAKYDKLGGLITKGGRKVKNGAFFDHKSGEPIEKPVVIFMIPVNNTIVEVPDGKEMPMEVKAAEILANAQKNLPKTDKERAARAKAKKAPAPVNESVSEEVDE